MSHTARVIDVIGFDGDDTLWHSEGVFALTQARFCELVSPYVDDADHEELERRLLDTERRNLNLFGYGVKGFTLSMVESAIEITDGRIPARLLQELIGLGKEMLDHPVELLDGVAEVVEELADRYRLVLVTKGDLMHQESKVARSGLADRFWRIEIVSEKDPATYRRLLWRHRVDPETFVMVGNSVRSDVLPVMEIGAFAVHIPYHVTWVHEHVDHDGSIPTLTGIRELPSWLGSVA